MPSDLPCVRQTRDLSLDQCGGRAERCWRSSDRDPEHEGGDLSVLSHPGFRVVWPPCHTLSIPWTPSHPSRSHPHSSRYPHSAL